MEVINIAMPPCSLEAEQAVLGAIILAGSDERFALHKIDSLNADAFWSDQHQEIYAGIYRLYLNKTPIDIITLSDSLKELGTLEKVGGLAYLGELAANITAPGNFEHYIKILLDKYMARQMISACNESAQSVLNKAGKPTKELLDEAEQKLFNLSQQGNKDGEAKNISTLFKEAIDEIYEREKNPSDICGLATGFKDLDKLTTGLYPGQLIIVAGRPAMGKTSFAMNIADYVSVHSGKHVLVFSMEMEAVDLVIRLISSGARVDQNRLRTGKLTDTDWVRVSKCIERREKANLSIQETPAMSTSEVRSQARRVAREYDLGLIVIDYLQLMKLPGYKWNRTNEISEISGALKALAKELKVPVIALSQLNRGLEQRPDKRPTMSDLRDSGAIEQDADIIAFVYRDEVYNPDSPDKGYAEIIIDKHRNGPLGMVKLTFLGHCTRFENGI